jgi:hypothetical protein
MTNPRVAVVLACTGEGSSLDASVAGFLREVQGRGEVVLVGGPGGHAQGLRMTPSWPSDAIGDGGTADGLRILRVPAGRLVPELWRDGLRAVDADWVAFSTSDMVPRAGWLDSMLEVASAPGINGVGGAIVPGDRLGPVGRAVYLQRYLNYNTGVGLPERPSGENALYRREGLAAVEDAWAEGFWETEVQRRLEASGGRWAGAPGAIVTYNGSTRLASIARQRVAHARRFGAIRAEGSGRGLHWLRCLATPVVPGLLLARAGRGLAGRGMSVRPWLTALPSFLVLAAAWASGETIGALSGRRVGARG